GQMLAHVEDRAELGAGEERLRQQQGVAEAVLVAHHLDRRGLFALRGAQRQPVTRLAQPTGGEALRDAVQPHLHRGRIGPALRRDRGVLQQGRQHAGVEAVAEALDLVQRALVITQQLLQRRTGDRRRMRVGHQFGVVHRAGDQVGVERRVVFQVQLLLALLELVQRRQADVDVAALDQLRHLPVEEGEQQGADVRAVHVRVGHDDDVVVAQLVGVVVLLADAGTQRGDQRADLGEDSILSKRAFSTLRILPFSGSTAWVLRLRPCLAEPPAESPSNRNSSHSAGSFSWQSASLPGRPAMSSAPLRRVISRALRAASRARAASTTLEAIALASFGCSSRNSPSFSLTACSTAVLTSEETSLSLVCEENFGSGTLTD